MRVTLTFGHDGDDTLMPRVISAYDEYTQDDWNGVPDWHTQAVEAAEKAGASQIRTATITIQDGEVEALFAQPELETDGGLESES